LAMPDSITALNGSAVPSGAAMLNARSDGHYTNYKAGDFSIDEYRRMKVKKTL
jgi:hypothetical protein